MVGGQVLPEELSGGVEGVDGGQRLYLRNCLVE